MSTENTSTATSTGPSVTVFAVGSNVHPWLYSFLGTESTVKTALQSTRQETGHSGFRTVAELQRLRSENPEGSEMYKIYDSLLTYLNNQALIDTGSQSKLLNFIASLDPDKPIMQYHRKTGEYIESTTLPDGRPGIERVERLGYTDTEQGKIVFDFSDI